MSTVKPSYHYEMPVHKWNMAVFFNTRIDNLITAKNEAFINGEVHKMYAAIRCIYRDISFVFNEDELRRLEGHFKKARDLLRAPVQATKALTAMSKKMNMIKAQKLLEDIDLLLTGVMNANEMILPNFKSKTGLKKIEERYGVKIDS